MTGELDDPLLHHGIGEGESTIGGGRYMDEDDGFGGGHGLKPSANGGFDDSELSNGIVGIDVSKKPRV